MPQQFAAIDLGTNTFHLMIVEATSSNLQDAKQVYRKSIPSKIGQGGINRGIITNEAIERAVGVLQIFKEVVLQYQIDPKDVSVIGTSAIRNANNQAEFIEIVKEKTAFEINVISGDEEASLIYDGIRAAIKLNQEPAMIMDIGGGSVEFIICNANKIFWKQSFEIGGQRLLETFMKTDPISASAVERLNDYLHQQLLPLSNACHQYAPVQLIGSSGTFDTLVAMRHNRIFNEPLEVSPVASAYPIDEFGIAYDLLISKNRAERLAVPGMIELRVDLIVVSMCLIRYVLQAFKIKTINVSSYSLKEGVLNRHLEKNHG